MEPIRPDEHNQIRDRFNNPKTPTEKPEPEQEPERHNFDLKPKPPTMFHQQFTLDLSAMGPRRYAAPMAWRTEQKAALSPEQDKAYDRLRQKEERRQDGQRTELQRRRNGQIAHEKRALRHQGAEPGPKVDKMAAVTIAAKETQSRILGLKQSRSTMDDFLEQAGPARERKGEGVCSGYV